MPATLTDAQNLTPEVLRNEIVREVDQMDRIEAGSQARFASALSVFPLVNLDNPQEAWYTHGGVRAPMSSSSLTSESPLGTLDLPSKDDITTDHYKKKYAPEKGVETDLDDTPYSIFARAADVIRTEIFLTREQITWRGDDTVDGLTGQYGDTPHPELDSDHVMNVSTAWSDTANSTPYDDVTSLAFEVINNGSLFGDGMMGSPGVPNLYASPSLIRDMRQSDALESRVEGVRTKTLDRNDVLDLLGNDINSIQEVRVYVPRTNANGEPIDDAGNVVDDYDDAARDNILEPYDPSSSTTRRNAVIGMPGAGSAFVPWFSEQLAERATDAPMTSDIAMDDQNGFFTQMWTGDDPIQSYFKGAQSIGFHLQEPENWAILSGV